jgi:ribonuclease HI
VCGFVIATSTTGEVLRKGVYLGPNFKVNMCEARAARLALEAVADL